MRKDPLAAAVLTAALGASVTGCNDSAESMSTDRAREEAKVILVARLAEDYSGRKMSRLVKAFGALPGVVATHGRTGRRVVVYSTPDISAQQLKEVREHLVAEPAVTSVRRTR